jgi:lysophospholipase L1-like esterase
MIPQIHKKHLLLLYIIIFHILLVTMLVKYGLVHINKMKLGVESGEFTNHYRTMIAFHTRIDNNLQDGAVLFIGDSHIQGLAVSSIISNAVNYGIGNDTTLGVIQRLPIYKSLNSAKSVVLAIGFNDLSLRSNSEIADNVRMILNYIPTTTNIVLCAVMPIDDNIWDDKSLNIRIIQLNSMLEGISSELNNVSFLNINDYITIDSKLGPKYHIGDGVHLSKEGYDIWIHHLKRFLNSL